MTWFKVDDGFYDHPKLDGLPNAAVGLWVKAGAWCSKHETDGVIPASRVKALKGTSSQISALIRCDLWVETVSESGAKAYSFRDWFDYQPSREERQEERAVWREKKRKSRRRKLDNQRGYRNVPQGVPEMSPEGNLEGVPEMSGTMPVPSRPDPSNIGTTSQPSNGEYGDTQGMAGLTLDDLAGATRRAREAGISDTAIAAGTRRFNDRPGPKGPGLLRTLIDDEWEAEQLKTRIETDRQARRAAIDACPLCDDQGMYDTGQGLARCTHEDSPPWEKYA